MNELLELLTYPFVSRALIAGSLISVSASILGCVLVLRHYSLIGHGLSEIGFASLSFASALNIPVMFISAPSVIISSFIIMFISRKYKTAGDIAIAAASSIALSLGVIVSSLTGSYSNISMYLFGSVLAMNDYDLILAVILSLLVIASFIVFYNRIFIITYNEDYARSLGINVNVFEGIISLLTALTVVLGMRIMGTLLISSVIILPAVSAKILESGFRMLVIMSAIISFIAFISGLIVSFIFNLPAGASVVIVNALILILLKLTVRHKS